MLRWQFVWFCVFLSTVAAGCAPVLSSPRMSGSALEFDVRYGSGELVTLSDGTGRVLNRSTVRGERVWFALPSTPIGRCLRLTHDGENALSTGAGVTTAPHAEFLSMVAEISRRTAAAQTARSELSASERDLLQNGQRLSQNRAYNKARQRCERPRQQLLPPRPSTRCSSGPACRRDAALVCATRYLGTQGCVRVANEFGISGIFAGPGCSAAVARMARERYTAEDMLSDAVWQGIDRWAQELRKSSDGFQKFWGWFGGAVVLARDAAQVKQCSDSFYKRHWGEVESWEHRRAEIEREPQQSLSECQWLTEQVQTLNTYRIPTLTSALSESNKAVERLKGTAARNRDRGRPVASCSP